jgi:hypothetical protein
MRSSNSGHVFPGIYKFALLGFISTPLVKQVYGVVSMYFIGLAPVDPQPLNQQWIVALMRNDWGHH